MKTEGKINVIGLLFRISVSASIAGASTYSGCYLQKLCVTER